MKGKKNSLSREEAVQLYEDLQRNMARIVGRNNMPPQARPAPQRAEPARAPIAARPIPERTMSQRSSSGASLAVSLVLLFAFARVVISGLEATGFAKAAPAEATMIGTDAAAMRVVPALQSQGQQYSKEEVALLTSLDQRRAELEDRRKRLDEREADLDGRDREVVARLAQLKEMSESLKHDREQGEKKKSTQLDQLANVYGSMDPKEAATLIEQLDVTIGLSLLQRMPEKRIGQILAMMSPARALTLTKMLSGKVE